MTSMRKRTVRDQGVSRREFVGTIAGGVAALGSRHVGASTRYRVARIASSDPYAGAVNALWASGEFPDVAGRTVIIKPNLVAKRTADTGITTDPEVVRAIVDTALGGGAASVKIVEGGAHGANFTDCGYDMFRTYDARVALLDLSTEAVTFTTLPAASPPAGTTGAPAAYQGIYLPTALLEPGAVFISVPKLKTHAEAMATLSVKNVFGLPPCTPYFDATRESFLPRYQLHARSLGQTIAGVALARPIDFAVVDGVWALEGYGPVDITGGTPVKADVIVAGRNPVAVDLTCLDMIGIQRGNVQHLEYAYLSGLGPSDMTQIDLVGDPVNIPPFVQPVIPPKVWFPRISPAQFSPARGEKATVAYRLTEASQMQVQLQVLKTSDRTPGEAVVRVLQPWTNLPAGSYGLQWNGRDDAGQVVAPAMYGIRVQARWSSSDTIIAAGINWVTTTT